MTGYTGPKIVLTRICVAMSGFIIHSAPDHWPSPITDIISLFSPHLQAARDILLKISSVHLYIFGQKVADC